MARGFPITQIHLNVAGGKNRCDSETKSPTKNQQTKAGNLEKRLYKIDDRCMGPIRKEKEKKGCMTSVFLIVGPKYSEKERTSP